eukprot:m.160230 g.160230  ORF g.160230 m.160230 type:complete len:999 (-) comp16357_c1_seq1:208-3204(-)
MAGYISFPEESLAQSARVGQMVRIIAPERINVHGQYGTVLDTPGGRNRAWYTIKLENSATLCKIRSCQLQVCLDPVFRSQLETDVRHSGPHRHPQVPRAATSQSLSSVGSRGTAPFEPQRQLQASYQPNYPGFAPPPTRGYSQYRLAPLPSPLRPAAIPTLQHPNMPFSVPSWEDNVASDASRKAMPLPASRYQLQSLIRLQAAEREEAGRLSRPNKESTRKFSQHDNDKDLPRQPGSSDSPGSSNDTQSLNQPSLAPRRRRGVQGASPSTLPSKRKKTLVPEAHVPPGSYAQSSHTKLVSTVNAAGRASVNKAHHPTKWADMFVDGPLVSTGPAPSLTVSQDEETGYDENLNISDVEFEDDGAADEDDENEDFQDWEDEILSDTAVATKGAGVLSPPPRTANDAQVQHHTSHARFWNELAPRLELGFGLMPIYQGGTWVSSGLGQAAVKHAMSFHELAGTSTAFVPLFQRPVSDDEIAETVRAGLAFKASFASIPNIPKGVCSASVLASTHSSESIPKPMSVMSALSRPSTNHSASTKRSDVEAPTICRPQAAQGLRSDATVFSPTTSVYQKTPCASSDDATPVPFDAAKLANIATLASSRLTKTHVWRRCIECQRRFVIAAGVSISCQTAAFPGVCSWRCFARCKTLSSPVIVRKAQATLPVIDHRTVSQLREDEPTRIQQEWVAGDVGIRQGLDPVVIVDAYFDSADREMLVCYNLKVAAPTQPQGTYDPAKLCRSQLLLDDTSVLRCAAEEITCKLPFTWELTSSQHTNALQDARRRYSSNHESEIEERVNKVARTRAQQPALGKPNKAHVKAQGLPEYEMAYLHSSNFPYLPKSTITQDPAIEYLWNYIMSEECKTPVIMDDEVEMPLQSALDTLSFNAFVARYCHTAGCLLGAHRQWRDLLHFVWRALPEPCRRRYLIPSQFNDNDSVAAILRLKQWEECPPLRHYEYSRDLTLAPLLWQPKKARSTAARNSNYPPNDVLLLGSPRPTSPSK